MATCILLRHARSTANAEGVLAGWTDGVGLDAVGREQAEELVARLGRTSLVRLVSSPLQRCQETAAPLVRAGMAAEVEVVDALGECHYGGWTGRPLAELAEEPLWKVVQETPSQAVFPPSPEHRHEGIAEMARRVVSAVRSLDAEVTAQHGAAAVWMAVTHGDVVKAVLADAVRTSLDDFQRIHVSPASLSVVRYDETGAAVLLRSNDTGRGEVIAPAGPADVTPGQAAVGGGAV